MTAVTYEKTIKGTADGVAVIVQARIKDGAAFQADVYLQLPGQGGPVRHPMAYHPYSATFAGWPVDALQEYGFSPV